MEFGSLCVPGTVLCPGDTVVKKTDRVLSLAGRQQQKTWVDGSQPPRELPRNPCLTPHPPLL